MLCLEGARDKFFSSLGLALDNGSGSKRGLFVCGIFRFRNRAQSSVVIGPSSVISRWKLADEGRPV